MAGCLKGPSTLLFLDWIRFPEAAWAAAGLGGEPPILKVSAITYDLLTARSVDEVSFCVQCDAVQRYLSPEEAQRVLGMSKIVYMVSNGKLETILPALLDKLDASQVTPAIWNLDRFTEEFKPHLLRALVGAEAPIAQVYSRVLVARDALRSRDPAATCDKPTALQASRALNMELRKQTELEAMTAVFRALNPEGALVDGTDLNRFVVPVRAAAGNNEPDYCGLLTKANNGGEVAMENSTARTEEEGPFVIRLRGLPWETTVAQIVDFLSPVLPPSSSSRANIHLVTGFQSKCSGEAYVELPTAEHRDRAIKELHGKLIGRRWIEVFKANAHDLRSCKSSRESSQSGVLRLRGLPWGSSEYDVARFFSDGGFSIDVDNIFIPPARGSRCSGEAWADFGSGQRADDARRALHRKSLGMRYIEIFPSSAKEMQIMQRNTGSSYRPTSTTRSRPSAGSRATPYAESDHHGPPSEEKASYRMPREWPSESSGGGHRYLSALGDSSDGALSIPSSNSLSGHQFAGTATSPPLMKIPPSPSTVSTNLPGSTDPYNNTSPSQPPFTVLRLRGLPYGSNENHIVHFFNGFSMTTILPSTVPVDGRPSGEAYVEFSSSDEALRAFQVKQGARIEHRYIELFPAQKQEMEFAAAGLDSREIRARLGNRNYGIA